MYVLIKIPAECRGIFRIRSTYLLTALEETLNYRLAVKSLKKTVFVAI